LSEKGVVLLGGIDYRHAFDQQGQGRAGFGAEFLAMLDE
jgi:hypothetical protein